MSNPTDSMPADDMRGVAQSQQRSGFNWSPTVILSGGTGILWRQPSDSLSWSSHIGELHSQIDFVKDYEPQSACERHGRFGAG